MSSWDDVTPHDPIGPDPIGQIQADIREVKVYCRRMADAAMEATAQIPVLQAEVKRLKAFRSWAPALLVAIVLVVQACVR